MSTSKLQLPEILASQDQKHVTHNEALFYLDQLVQLSVLDRHLAAPPVSPSEGDAYIVASPATGDWLGKENDVAIYDGDGWLFRTPRNGWSAWVEDEAAAYRLIGGAWVNAAVLASTVNGASLSLAVLEEELTSLSGASVATTIEIPNRCVLQGVSVRTTEAITGATSFDCGPTGGSASAYGGSLGIGLGDTNIGVIGPTAFYSNTTVTLTANGGNFTGGAVRVALHYMSLTAPSS